MGLEEPKVEEVSVRMCVAEERVAEIPLQYRLASSVWADFPLENVFSRFQFRIFSLPPQTQFSL